MVADNSSSNVAHSKYRTSSKVHTRKKFENEIGKFFRNPSVLEVFFFHSFIIVAYVAVRKN